MIPAFLVARYGPKIAAIIFWGCTALLAVLLLVGAYFAVKRHFTAPIEAQARVATAQGQAQADSGHDAVQTVGNVMGNDHAADVITEENSNAIDHANGADAAVDPAVRAAGLHALCARASYRQSHPACL